MISPEKDKILIFDVNGFIAGMNSIFPTSAKKASGYDYNKSGWYRIVTINSIEYYMTTAYFMNPSKICIEGRVGRKK